MICPVRPDLVVLLLVGVRDVGHALHVGELAVRSAGVTKGTTLRLNCPLGVNIFVPALHGIFILVTDDEVVDDTRVTLPEDLDAIETCS